jgi:putative MATE family efflux protein
MPNRFLAIFTFISIPLVSSFSSRVPLKSASVHHHFLVSVQKRNRGIMLLPLSKLDDRHNEDNPVETDPLLPVDAQPEEPSIGQEILDLAIPALWALLMDPFMALIDTAFVGRFSDSPDQLAGMGSAAALLTFSFYLFNFLCFATTPIVSKERAAGNEQMAISVSGQALSLALLLGTILTVVLVTASQPLLHIMGTLRTGLTANRYATEFLTVRALAAPAVLCISASTGILRGYLDTKTPLYILAFANTINITLDYILIAKLGMGPMGAAIATTSAEWISAITFLLILSSNLPSATGQLGSNRDDKKSVTITPALSIPPWNEVKSLLVASSSLLLRSLVLQITLSGAAGMAARSGLQDAAVSVAAHQIAIQLWLLCNFICDALEAAAQGLVADALGRNSQKRARKISNAIFLYSLILGIGLSLALWIGDSSGFLVHLFTRDDRTQIKLKDILIIVTLAQPLNALVFAADGILQGATEFLFQAKAMALSASIAVIFFLIIHHEGDLRVLEHVWESLIVLQAVRGLTSLYKLADQDGPINLFASSED